MKTEELAVAQSQIRVGLTLTLLYPVLPFSKLNNFIFGYFDPENVFLIMKINNFRGDPTDNSAKKEALVKYRHFSWNKYAGGETNTPRMRHFREDTAVILRVGDALHFMSFKFNCTASAACRIGSKISPSLATWTTPDPPSTCTSAFVLAESWLRHPEK